MQYREFGVSSCKFRGESNGLYLIGTGAIDVTQ